MASNEERTYIMIKPDSFQRKLVGEIIRRFEKKGFHLVAMKMLKVFSRSDFLNVQRLSLLVL